MTLKSKLTVCDVPGCNKPGRGVSGKVCEMHYIRKRRTGSYELKQRPVRIMQSAGYVLAKSSGNPLSNGRYREYEHRLVYHRIHGEGPFLCHWCGKAVDWRTLHIDHLNDKKDDNRPENLVASCPACNQSRGKHKMIAKKSLWLTLGTERLTLRQWAKRIGIRPSSIRRRMAKGWSIEKTLTAPRGKFGPKQLIALEDQL